jgi:hypothetical protein
MKTLKILLGLVMLLATVLLTGYAHAEGANVVYSVLLFTATTGAGAVTLNSPNFCPAFIYFVATTAPQGLRITPQGDSMSIDLDATGLAAFANIRLIGGAVTNSYTIPIADGKLPAQGIDIVFTNGASITPNVYGMSMGKGANLYMSIRQQVLANSGTTFDKFAFISFPSLGATDYVNIIWNDGLQETFNRDELAGMVPMTQGIAANYSIDNMKQQIQSVTLYGAAQTAYILRVRPSLKPAF